MASALCCLLSALYLCVGSISVTEVLLMLSESNVRYWNLHGYVLEVSSETRPVLLDTRKLHQNQLPTMQVTSRKNLMPFFGSDHIRFGPIKIFVEQITKMQAAHLTSCDYCFFVLIFKDSGLLSDFVQLQPFRALRYKVLCLTGDEISKNAVLLTETQIPDKFAPVSLHVGSIPPMIFNLNRLQFRNAHLRIAAFISEPFVVVDDHGRPSSGMSVELFKAASAALNFTYEIVPFPRKYFKWPNGTWRGIIGALIEDRVDFISGSTAATSERLKLLTYGTHGFYYELTFITRQPGRSRPRNAFIHPFSPQVWTCLLILMGCLTLNLILISRSYGLQNAMLAPPTIVLAMLLAQSTRTSRPLRLPLTFWLIGGVLIVNYYCSNLLSHITLPRLDKVPRTFESLAQRMDFTIEMIHVPGITAHVFFNKTSIPAVVSIRQRYSLTFDFVGCVVRAGTEALTACIGGTDNLLPIIHRKLKLRQEFKAILFAEEAAKLTFLHSVLPKNSKYLDAVNFITGGTRDSGLVSKWFANVLDSYEILGREWLRGENGTEVARKLEFVADSMVDTTAKPFGLRHLNMGFGLLLIGSGAAFVVMVLEIAFAQAWTFAMWVRLILLLVPRIIGNLVIPLGQCVQSQRKEAWLA